MSFIQLVRALGTHRPAPDHAYSAPDTSSKAT